MRIKRLELKNFRGFEELTINFPEDSNVAVFVGVNGSGKTSVLEGIVKLLEHFVFELPDKGEYEEIIDFKLQDKSDNKDDIKKGKDLCATTLIFNHIQDFTAFNEIRRTGFTISLSPPFGRLLYELPENLLVEEFKNTPYNLSQQRQLRKELREKLTTIAFYQTERYVNKKSALNVIDISKTSPITVLINAFNSEKGFEYFYSWFRSFEDIENEQIRFSDNVKFRSKELEAVRRAIKSFPPFFSNPRVQRQPQEELIVEKNGEKLSISNLSHGERLMFAMVGDIARRLSIANPGLDDPLQGEGVVLIDEIELHLHPGWQRKIVPLLTKIFPNIQFILTTHSPVVLSSVKRENIFILEDFKLVQKTPHTYGRDVNSILYQTFGLDEREEKVEAEFRKLYALIDDPERVEEAKETLEKMKEKYGADDPELIRADMHFEFLTN